MSAVEFDEWMSFSHLYGPLTVQERLEHMLAAQMALQAAIATGKEHAVADFRPRWDPKAPESQSGPSPEDLIAAIDTYKKKSKRRRKPIPQGE